MAQPDPFLSGVKLRDAIYALPVEKASALEVLFLLTLAKHKNPKTGQCNPGYKLLMRETRLSRETLSRVVKSLKKKGLLLAIRYSRVLPPAYIPLPTEQELKDHSVEKEEGVVSERHQGGVRETPGWCQRDTRVVSERHLNKQENKQEKKAKEQSEILLSPSDSVSSESEFTPPRLGSEWEQCYD